MSWTVCWTRLHSPRAGFAISLNRDRLGDALAAHREAPDPADIDWIVPEDQLRGDWRAARVAEARVSAVLVAINERSNGTTEVILTERALHLPKHPGQISFPGGAREAVDISLADTALREAYEEVALPRQQVEVLGYLRPQWTISGYSMTPVVGYVKGDIELQADPAEVESVFSVPADYLFDAENYRHGERDIQGVAWPMVELFWQEKRIWGATAHVILRLQKLLEKSGL